MNHNDFRIEDLIHDPSFQHWVYRTNKADVKYWEKWIALHPEQRTVVDDAARIIKGVKFKPHTLPEEVVQKYWRQLNQRIQKEQKRPTRILRTFVTHPYTKAAAVLLLFLSAAYYLFFRHSFEQIHYASNYAELINIDLPDGSLVTLNANSTLTFHDHWDDEDPREVWLQGEAYFEVTHKASEQQFIVHTDEVNIEVLGTEFGVNTRRQKTQVVLNSGQVKLNSDKNQEVKGLVMVPGELIEVSDAENAFTRKVVNPEVYTAWRNNLLIFEETPIREIAKILEDNYGYEVMIENKDIEEKRFNGTIQADKLDILLTAIAETHQLNITQDNNKLIIKNHPD